MSEAPRRPELDATLIRERAAATVRLRRKRHGFWRTMGRSNRLFPRKLMVTRDGKWIIAMSLLLGVGAVNTGNNLLYLVLSLLISIIAISGVLSEMDLADIKVVRRYPHELEVGEAAMLRTEVHNTKRRAAFNLEVDEVIEDDAFAMRPGYVLHLHAGEVGQCFVMVRPKRRGPVRSAGIRVLTSYPFGFARKSRLYVDPQTWLVLPRVADIALDGARGGGRGDLAQTRRKGHGSEFLGLRDWRHGDPTRDLHWKISARRGRLIAREWEEEATRAALVEFVHVAPDAGDDPQQLDAACETVAGLCASLLHEGMAVGLRTFAGTVAPQPDFDGSADQLLHIRRLLANLLLADRPPPPEWPVEDDRWVDAVRRAWSVHDQLASGAALTFPDGNGPLTHDRIRVSYLARRDARIEGVPPTVEVLLDTAGEVISIERPDADVAGAA